MTVGSRPRRGESATRRGPRRPSDVAASWFASLQSVGAEYRRAEAAARAAADRETVRLRREARADARATAACLLDGQRWRFTLAQQTDRRALATALERRDSARRKVVLL